MLFRSKEAIDENVKKLKELAAKDDVTKEELDKASEEMFKSAQKIGEVMQKEQAAKAGAAAPGADTEGSAGAGAGVGADADGEAKSKPKTDAEGVEEAEVVNE